MNGVILPFLVGSLLVAGLCAVGLGLVGTKRPADTPGKPDRQPSGQNMPFDRRRLLAGVAGAFGALVATRWPLMAVWGFLAGWGGTIAYQNTQERKRQFAIAEGLIDWVDALRSTVEAGAGLQRAIEITADGVRDSIKAEVVSLVGDLRAGEFIVALRRFARSVAHPSSDSLATVLLLVYRRGGQPQQELRALSRELAAQMRVWHAIEGGKKSVYSQAKTIGGISLSILGYFVLFRRDFVAPYGTYFGGTVGLGAVGVLFAVGAWRIYQLGAWQPLDRPSAAIAEQSHEFGPVEPR